METPRGRILSVSETAHPLRVVVEVEASVRCARCASGKGCGAGLVDGDTRPRRVDAVVAGGLDVRRGDQVSIELAPQNLLQAARIVYGLPLAGAVGGAALAWGLGLGDAGAAIAALGGIVIGLASGWLRLRNARCLRRFTPVVTGLLAGEGS